MTNYFNNNDDDDDDDDDDYNNNNNNNKKLVFDSIPHSWAEKSIELVGVNGKILRFCKLSMEKWNIRLHLKTTQK